MNSGMVTKMYAIAFDLKIDGLKHAHNESYNKPTMKSNKNLEFGFE